MQKNLRSPIERRTVRNRRRRFSLRGFFFNRRDQRESRERRSTEERRGNWVRVCKWSSAPLNRLKLSKYLLGKSSLTRNGAKL